MLRRFCNTKYDIAVEKSNFFSFLLHIRKRISILLPDPNHFDFGTVEIKIPFSSVQIIRTDRGYFFSRIPSAHRTFKPLGNAEGNVASYLCCAREFRNSATFTMCPKDDVSPGRRTTNLTNAFLPGGFQARFERPIFLLHYNNNTRCSAIVTDVRRAGKSINAILLFNGRSLFVCFIASLKKTSRRITIEQRGKTKSKIITTLL